ncbi:plasma membrane H+-ATPase [Ceratobasidium sp. 423]|nr:plasma membrane H+-ATPase [Ceratobasidium sp. 423]
MAPQAPANPNTPAPANRACPPAEGAPMEIDDLHKITHHCPITFSHKFEMHCHVRMVHIAKEVQAVVEGHLTRSKATVSTLMSIHFKVHLDAILRGSIHKQDETEGVIISTGGNTFFGWATFLILQGDSTTDHLQKIFTLISSFCLVSIDTFILLDTVVPCPHFHCLYSCSLNNIVMPWIGHIVIAVPTVLFVTLTLKIVLAFTPVL